MDGKGGKDVFCVLLAPCPWQTSNMHAERDSVGFCGILFSVHSFITSCSVLSERTPLRVMGCGSDEVGVMQGKY